MPKQAEKISSALNSYKDTLEDLSKKTMISIKGQNDTMKEEINLEIEKFLQKEAQTMIAREKDKTQEMKLQ